MKQRRNVSSGRRRFAREAALPECRKTETHGEQENVNLPHLPGLEAIGIVETPFSRPEGTPIQPSRASGARGRVLVAPRYQAGLKDLEGFERIWLVYWLHRAPRARLHVTPFLDHRERGVFATRTPARPVPIGISAVRLLSVSGGTLEIADVDILNGTPLLDIKPYVPEFDSHPESRAGWFDNSDSSRKVADSRFAEEED
jgi:tRNA-Thr(GGU) m(6)t(6)A37 methyltransferase TsaA